MFSVLRVLTVILVAVAMALPLGHALELLAKMRLDKETYYAMQPVYYPGFTFGGGIDDLGGTISTMIFLFLSPLGSTDFWLTLVALRGLNGMQAVYWLFTHPVNKFWAEGENLDRFSSGVFSFGANRSRRQNETRPPDWTESRDRWEYSHAARVGIGLVTLTTLVI